MDEKLSNILTDLVKKQCESEECFIQQFDIRKKIPKEDQDCLVRYEDLQSSFNWHRAYYSEGHFISLESKNSFPLLVTHWMPIPEIED